MHFILLQDVVRTYDYSGSAALFVMLIPFFIFFSIFAVISLVAHWVIYTKAGEEGWAAIIPFYNIIVLLKIIGKPWWWLFLLFIPLLNLIWAIWMTNLLSKSFGKDEGFTVGLILLGIVFYPILAFGKAQYQGPFGDPEAYKAFQASKQSFDFEKKTA